MATSDLARIALCTLVLQVGGIGYSLACSCQQTIQEADYDVIFVGEVQRTSGGCAQQRTAHFEVTQAIKGVSDGEALQVAHDRSDGGNCGIDFADGDTATIYAYRQDGELRTNSCSVRW